RGVEAIVMVLALAALVIDQMAQMIALPSAPRRRADHAVILGEVGDNEPPAAPYRRRLWQPGENLPVHECPHIPLTERLSLAGMFEERAAARGVPCRAL